jgi:hypothetical protein
LCSTAGQWRHTIARQDAPHATLRIFHIAKIAGNQVNMHVHSRLARRLTDIYPDVVSIGRVFGVDVSLCLAKKLDNRELFLGRHFEEVGYVALRNDEDMTTAERMAVRAHIRQVILGQHGSGRTKLALFTLFHRSPLVLADDSVERPATSAFRTNDW